MKKTILIPGLALACALAGTVAWMLRSWLLTAGVDEKGLLTAGHPGAILSGILTAAVAVLVAAALWYRRGGLRSSGSPLSAALRALALGLGGVLLWKQGLLGKLAAISGTGAALLTLIAIPAGRKEKKLALPADFAVLLFFMLCLLSRYQSWSAEPESQRYVFSLLALVCMMLAVYQRSAMELEMAGGSFYWGTGCLGIYFAFAAAADPGFTAFFLLLGVWMLTELCTAKGEDRRVPA